MTDRTWMRGATATLSVALAIGLAACGSSSSGGQKDAARAKLPGAGKPPITMGDKNFTEEYVLGQLYSQALEAKGYKVDLKENIGSSEITDKALTSGSIQMYPEYTGTILSELAHQTRRPGSARATYAAARRFEQGRGFTLLDPTPFSDSDAIGVLKSYATAHHLHSVVDLKPLNGQFTLAGPPEFRTRFEGLLGLERVYGLHPASFKPLSIGLQYRALDARKIDTADVFTTDAQLRSGRYTVLTDPKGIFGYQNVAPVVSDKLVAREGPAFARTLNAVSAKLTTGAMQKMNAAVALDKRKPADVAKAFLKANGLG